jgi:hypothetical protein
MPFSITYIRCLNSDVAEWLDERTEYTFNFNREDEGTLMIEDDAVAVEFKLTWL